MHVRVPLLTLVFTFWSLGAAIRAQDQPLSPQEAAASTIVPDGFHVTLFAGEPDVVQPIAFTFDRRGRLWVVECHSYPDWSADAAGRDRVLIFEDLDADGRFDRRTVFWDQGSNLSGIELGFGGVWLCSAPNLIFVPDRDGNDVPDGPPETLLDGWALDAQHNVFNGLTWGPDGWLYGCNGILSRSRVGRPGTPDAQRVALDCGVWRYHPTNRSFEAVAWGTTNPWGLAFDAYGQMFITNCVINHVFHVVPGIHMVRMFGQDLNPFTYHLVPGCADHLHWAGGYWDTAIGGKHNETGGGHAHAGAMIYQADNWPEQYRGRLYLHNIHGRRVNSDRLVRHGAGYVAQHSDDVIQSQDPWQRGLELKYGPDGSVYLSDWNDTGECHDRDSTEKGTGRIFRVAWGTPEPVDLKLESLDDAALIALQTHDNEWMARHARLELQERAADASLQSDTLTTAWQAFQRAVETTRLLRHLWTLHAVGALDEPRSLEVLKHADPYVRAWAVQFALENRRPSAAVRQRLGEMASSDDSPLVRLYLAAGLQRLEAADRWSIAERLVAHAGDRHDPNVAPLVWYGIEPLVPDAQGRDVHLLTQGQLPLVRRCIARRLTANGQPGIERLMACLSEPYSADVQADILAGLLDELQGLRELPMPADWPALQRQLLSLHQQPDVRDTIRSLSLIFGDPSTRRELIESAHEGAHPPEQRRKALESLIAVRAQGLAPTLHALLDDSAVRDLAVRGLAFYDHAETPRALLARYASLPAVLRHDVLVTLTTRADYAEALVQALEDGRVPLRDVSGWIATQLRQLNNRALTERFVKVWGNVQVTPEHQRQQIARLKSLLTPERLANADASRGKRLFVTKCASCHQLFGEGANVGPDLTGSQRENVDYVLANLVTPNALVPGDFLVRSFVMSDGRLISGIVAAETPRTVTVQTLNDRVVLVRDEVEEEVRTALSMMPEGLLDDLTDAEITDLVAFLAGSQSGRPTQLP
jgi:putative membrane-bound dehydrogenase-like protein